jgi:hypothetical protein
MRANEDGWRDASPAAEPEEDDVPEDMKMIAMHPALVPAFEEWLASRHLHLFRIPGGFEADPVFAVGISDSHPVLRLADALDPDID